MHVCLEIIALLPETTWLTWRLIFHLLSFSFAFSSFAKYCSICSFRLPFSYFTLSEEDSSQDLLYMQASLACTIHVGDLCRQVTMHPVPKSSLFNVVANVRRFLGLQ